MKYKTNLDMMLNGYLIYDLPVWIVSGRRDIYWSCKRSEGGNWGKFDEILCFPGVQIGIEFVDGVVS